MEIIINENYKLISEQNRFNISKRRIKNKYAALGSKDIIGTEEVWEDQSYGHNLENAIQNIILDMLQSSNNVITLKEYVEEYKKHKEELLNKLKL